MENIIPNFSSLVKKTDYDTKISELEEKFTDHNHDKYITTPEFNTLAASVFNARLANTILAHCTLCYFQYFLQSTLELVAIFFDFIAT